jgi:hypothetical protein
MVLASALKTGTILQVEGNLYKVLVTKYHMGGGKMSSLQDEVYKPATLSNGLQIQVPQFIKVRDVAKVSVATKKYIERAKR